MAAERPGQGQIQDEATQAALTGQATDALDMPTIQPFTQDELRARLLTKIFVNNDNWCYANSVIMTLFWTHWSSTTFSLTDLGMHSQDVLSFMHQASQTINFHDFPWYQHLFLAWNGEDRQQDAAEFLAFLAGSLESPRFHLA